MKQGGYLGCFFFLYFCEELKCLKNSQFQFDDIIIFMAYTVSEKSLQSLKNSNCDFSFWISGNICYHSFLHSRIELLK